MNGPGSEAFTLFGRRTKWVDTAGNVVGLTAPAPGRRRSLRTGPVRLPSGAVLRFSGFVHIINGALVPWGMRDRWLRSRKAGQPVLEGVPA